MARSWKASPSRRKTNVVAVLLVLAALGASQVEAAPGGGTDYAPEIELCLPSPLHPVSRMLLDHWLAGRLSTIFFRRWFHLPNSSYIDVSACILANHVQHD